MNRFLVELVVNFSQTSLKLLLQVKGRLMATERRKIKGPRPESRFNSVIRHCMTMVNDEV
jgi:hypothetical protein